MTHGLWGLRMKESGSWLTKNVHKHGTSWVREWGGTGMFQKQDLMSFDSKEVAEKFLIELVVRGIPADKIEAAQLPLERS